MNKFNGADFFDLKSTLIKKIQKNGGFVNCHAHFDRAYTINNDNLNLANKLLEDKWKLIDEIKKKSSQEDFFLRISRALNFMISQGVKVCASFIDIDPIVEYRALDAALLAKKRFKDKINFLIVNQTLKGVLQKKARKYIENSINKIDIIGGLPSKDRPNEDKHIDYILWLAKETGKKAQIHIDQENNPKEKDTELLARKVIKNNLEGKITAIHAVSLSAQTPQYRKKVYSLLKNGGISIIVCPSAAVNMKEVPFKSFVHKPIAPVLEMTKEGIIVGLGTDNIYDIYEPFIDGDMWFETRLLMEVCRYYDLEEVARIVSINGRLILK